MINQDLLNSWADNFIFNNLENLIIHFINDHEEHEDYITDIEVENYENDLQKILNDQINYLISINYVYNDIESD